MTSKFYYGPPRLRIDSDLEAMFPLSKGDFVFVEDMSDLFGDWVPTEMIQKVLEKCGRHPETRFLFLTKNPKRYRGFLPLLYKINGILGVTLETNRSTWPYSQAPQPFERWQSFFDIEYTPKFVALEPIMDFDSHTFSEMLFNITNLESVAVGYDNYYNHLPEPPLAKTFSLIEQLEKNRITVFRKTLREAWNHNIKS